MLSTGLKRKPSCSSVLNWFTFCTAIFSATNWYTWCTMTHVNEMNRIPLSELKYNCFCVFILLINYFKVTYPPHMLLRNRSGTVHELYEA